MNMPRTAIGPIIAAIGEPDFASRTASELCAVSGFDHASIIMYDHERTTRLLHDDFRATGQQFKLDALAPMLPSFTMESGARLPADARREDCAVCIESMPGKGTLGAACKGHCGVGVAGGSTEQIALHLSAAIGLIEIRLYRQRGAAEVHAKLLAAFEAMARPLAAAFDRHFKLRPDRADLTPDRNGAACLQALSAREAEVCELLLEGCSNEKIALRIGISPFTAKDHRKNIYRKLGLSTLAELFLLAHRFPLWRDWLQTQSAENSLISH